LKWENQGIINFIQNKVVVRHMIGSWNLVALFSASYNILSKVLAPRIKRVETHIVRPKNTSLISVGIL
jgi:hypothetical protein